MEWTDSKSGSGTGIPLSLQDTHHLGPDSSNVVLYDFDLGGRKRALVFRNADFDFEAESMDSTSPSSLSACCAAEQMALCEEFSTGRRVFSRIFSTTAGGHPGRSHLPRRGG